ncbi:hypothetical protein IAR55_003528 [Kwoniella newhampshirensis]|uniref:Uncharacterized protein n=1 Tax=Kwoniella newhampshirensis TaxID=1651941 RepID=A0AAW0YZK1_9TREE
MRFSQSHSSSLLKPVLSPISQLTKAKPKTSTSTSTSTIVQERDKDQQLLEDGLAICLFGYTLQARAQNQAQGLTQEEVDKKAITSATNEAEDEKENDQDNDRETKKQKLDTSGENDHENRKQAQDQVKAVYSGPPLRRKESIDDMYDMAYGEEVRQQAVMAEVLPDADMWRKWEKTEAPLRQGRGWYPTLDRHFLELLVISEIHCLSHPLATSPNPTQADRIHRHASRVRRVACERIGTERLNAYCDRVKEAFEAYMMGGWQHHLPTLTQQQQQQQQQQQEEDGEVEIGILVGLGDEVEIEHDEGLISHSTRDDMNVATMLKGKDVSDEEEEEDKVRGRTLERGPGSRQRSEKFPSPNSPSQVHQSEDDIDTFGHGRAGLSTISSAFASGSGGSDMDTGEDDINELKDVQLVEPELGPSFSSSQRLQGVNDGDGDDDDDDVVVVLEGQSSVEASYGSSSSSVSVDTIGTDREDNRPGYHDAELDVEMSDDTVTYSTLVRSDDQKDNVKNHKIHTSTQIGPSYPVEEIL